MLVGDDLYYMDNYTAEGIDDYILTLTSFVNVNTFTGLFDDEESLTIICLHIKKLVEIKKLAETRTNNIFKYYYLKRKLNKKIEMFCNGKIVNGQLPEKVYDKLEIFLSKHYGWEES